MRRNTKMLAGLAGAAVAASLFGAGAAHAVVPTGRLGLCIGDAPGTTDQVIAEGRTYIKPFTLTVAKGQTAACRAFDVAPGKYWITGGKYPQVPCDPYEHRGAIGPHVCLGKVHHFHVTHKDTLTGMPAPGPYTKAVGADSTIEQPALFVQVRANEFTEVRFHVVDAGTYPECTPSSTRSCS